ncbi:hypothetical protein V6N13_054212 [Hibiscus sabdariffa]
MASWGRRSTAVAHHMRAFFTANKTAQIRIGTRRYPFFNPAVSSALVPRPWPSIINMTSLFLVNRFTSSVAGSQAGSRHADDDNDDNLVKKELAVKMYSDMVTLQIMDTFFYEAQRQGRISFYMTSSGEEAINISSAAALGKDDIIMPQYREHGILLWRGFSLQEFANQCFGNKDDVGKGRQMPIHYGSSKHNFITVSSPIATQLPQAAGVAYSLKMDKKDACVVAFIGDGGTSQGDFHAGLNFAAVMEAPVIFVCRNNGWAISTPISEQFRSDGVAVKGQAYGIPSIRVDGTDALAVYSAIRAARNMAVNEQRPVLVETLAYRVGHHSTSDDSTKYRSLDEIEQWKTDRDPVNRFRKWVELNGWWSEREETELRSNVKKEATDESDSSGGGKEEASAHGVVHGCLRSPTV